MLRLLIISASVLLCIGCESMEARKNLVIHSRANELKVVVDRADEVILSSLQSYSLLVVSSNEKSILGEGKKFEFEGGVIYRWIGKSPARVTVVVFSRSFDLKENVYSALRREFGRRTEFIFR